MKVYRVSQYYFTNHNLSIYFTKPNQNKMFLSIQDTNNKVQSQSGNKAFLDEDQLMGYIANYVGVILDECLSLNKQFRVVWLQNSQLPFHPERIGDIKDSM